MTWGIWCDEPNCWLRDALGQPRRFTDKLDAIVAKNQMRRMWRTARERDPKYDYHVAPFVES
jgi:hypothetical protein